MGFGIEVKSDEELDEHGKRPILERVEDQPHSEENIRKREEECRRKKSPPLNIDLNNLFRPEGREKIVRILINIVGLTK